MLNDDAAYLCNAVCSLLIFHKPCGTALALIEGTGGCVKLAQASSSVLGSVLVLGMFG